MSSPPVNSYEFGSFRIDMQRYLLLHDEQPIQLSPKAFKTLLVLVENRDRILKKEELLNAVWPDSYVEESNLAQNIFVLRKALGDEKSDHKYIVTIPGTGYRFVASVNEAGPEAGASATEVPAVEGAPMVSSIAVLPFKSLHEEGADEFLGLGLADALVSRLSNIRQLLVRPTFAVLGYRNLQSDPVSVGRELKVDSLVYGVFQRDGDQIRVSVQLVKVQEGATLWAATFHESFTNVFSIQDSISEQVAQALALKLSGEEQRQITRKYAHNTEAFQLFIKGRYFWNQRTADALKRGMGYAQQAIAIDPTYAPAYVGLADTYNLLAGHAGLVPTETFPKAKAAAMRALEIDDELPEAYASLAFTNYRFEWDWGVSEKNFLHAIKLKPNYPTAHHWYGESLACMGRFDESLAELKIAHELDPLSLPVNTDIAQSLYYARRYDECETQSQQALEMDPTFVRAQIILGAALEQMERYEEAASVFARAVELSERNLLAMSGQGYVYARMGKKKLAQEILDYLEELSRHQYVSAYHVSVIYAGLRQNQKTLTNLERAHTERAVFLVWLNVNPRFDFLRGEPRFAELVKSIGLK
ncbi:MAG TPA: winged helix-turn-helix domain-containing protein [Pyrinomonadaceae bacterium]|nr:winged helix-turn-helix domain-containing protein [Pyrinomonadaceae bacterium]